MRSCCVKLEAQWIGRDLFYVCKTCGMKIDYGRMIMYEELETIDKMAIKKRYRSRDRKKQA